MEIEILKLILADFERTVKKTTRPGEGVQQ